MVVMLKSLAQAYFDSADVIMIVVNSDEILADINRKGCEILGYSREDIVGRNWFVIASPEDVREKVRSRFHEMLEGSLRHVHSEYPVLKKNGEELVISWHNILVSDERSNTIGTLSSGADITDMRRAERLMKETETRLQRTMESMLEGCQIIDYDWRYLYVNAAVASQGRRTKEELLGRTMMEMYSGIENTEMFGHLQECMTKRIPHQMENEFKFPDGSKGWFELRIEPVPEGILILSLDITKRKELEQELQRYRDRLEEVVAKRTAECAKANEQLSQEIEEHRRVEEGLTLRATILDKVGVPIFLVNSKGDFVYANDETCKTYGYSREEFLNLNLSELVRPEEAPTIASYLKEVFDKGHVVLETIHLRKDGSLMKVKVCHDLVETLHGKFIVSVLKTPKN